VKNLSLLEVNNLKTYFYTLRGVVRAVDGISFHIDEGMAFGLAGESGCGKSTTALSIMGLIKDPGKIVDGEIVFEGEDLLKKTKEELNQIRWKKISMIFQGAMNAFNPVHRVGDQIVEAILYHENISREEAWEKAEKLLEMVGIDPSRAKNYPHEFSGGMKQRAMIAMALSCNPKLVIADEPTTALDVIVQKQVLDLMKELQKKLKLSIMLISHDLSVIAQMCDSVAIMYAGKIVEYADAISLFKEPQHPYSKGLINSFPNILNPGKKPESIPGQPPSLINPPPGCRFHPRCPFATDKCREVEPHLVNIGNKHFVACHLIGG